MLKVHNAYVLVSKEEKSFELVEDHIFTRRDIDNIGFPIGLNSNETVFAITIDEWSKQNKQMVEK